MILNKMMLILSAILQYEGEATSTTTVRTIIGSSTIVSTSKEVTTEDGINFTTTISPASFLATTEKQRITNLENTTKEITTNTTSTFTITKAPVPLSTATENQTTENLAPPSTTEALMATAIITTQESTTASITKTTVEPATPRPITGIFYNETADYYFPEVGDNYYHKYPLFGMFYLVMDVKYKNDKDKQCWYNPKNCEEGFSASIWGNITFHRDAQTAKYIYSTGLEGETGPGIGLYFKGMHLFALVSTGDEIWNVTAVGAMINNTWSEIGIRWTKETGLELFINAVRISHALYPDKVYPDTQRTRPVKLMIGCRDTLYIGLADFGSGEYDEMAVWMWALAEEEEHFFLGGYDLTSGCNPELFILRCETNLQKILENVDNFEIESPDGLIDALDHIKSLSEVQKDPPGSDSNADGNAHIKYKEEVRVLVSIVGKLIDKTWDKPKFLEVKDLEKIMRLLQGIVSNVLEDKYTEGWQDLTNAGISSIDFFNRVSSYQVHKTANTYYYEEESIRLNLNTPNIMTTLRDYQLFRILAREKPITFPPEGDDDGEKEWKKKKKHTEIADENNGIEEEDRKVVTNVKLTIAKNSFGKINKNQRITYVGAIYKNLHRISPLWNKIADSEDKFIFIDSEIVSVISDVDPSSGNLMRKPVSITFKHIRKVNESGRNNVYDKNVQEYDEIKRECARWDANLETKGMKIKGGWTTDSCFVFNSTAEETTCHCTVIGTYAIISTIMPLFFVPEEEKWKKWVTATKWIGYGLSIVLLLFYIIVITIKKTFHEQFHIIRLNLSIAALGASISFLLSDSYENVSICRIISLLALFFYVAVGTWLTSEAYTLYSALVKESFGSISPFYVMIRWVIPACISGGYSIFMHNYGYDIRFLADCTSAKRMVLAGPVVFAALVAFAYALLICFKYGMSSVKSTAIINELSSSIRRNFIVVFLFFATWLFGMFGSIDFGFDIGEIPAFNTIFQIMNSFLGLFIVTFTGFGSKYFRHGLCNSERSKNWKKALYLHPFDFHDKPHIAKIKYIYENLEISSAKEEEQSEYI